MRKKILASLLILPVICSCKKVHIPDDIAQFLYTIDINKTMEKTLDINVTNDNSIYDKNDKLIGSDHYDIVVNRRQKEQYHYSKTETFSGASISFDTETSLYVTKTVTTMTYNLNENIYTAIVVNKGYSDEKKPEDLVEKTKATYRYTINNFKDVDATIFYTSDTGGIKTGGLYYADFFKNNLSQLEYFKIEDNVFIYTIEDKKYTQGSESAIVNEVIKMNSDGLLQSVTMKATNTSTRIYSVASTIATYNA